MDAYFQLWQKQVSLLAQSPEKSFEILIDEGRMIASKFEAALPAKPESFTDKNETDASDPS